MTTFAAMVESIKFILELPVMNQLIKLVIPAFVFFSNSEAQVFNITDFGALPDATTLNTEAIQTAIDACNKNGGGKVYVPAGTFITGTLELRSNVNLYLETGAELKGSSNMDDYKDYQAPNYEEPSHYGMIYSHCTENVTITRQGVINGSEKVFFEWDQAKTIYMVFM